jgi:rubrerythrin
LVPDEGATRGFKNFIWNIFQINPKEQHMQTTNLLEAIRVVKENERMASEFYANAANTTGSSLGRELFKQLRAFEEFHYARLTVLEKSLELKGDYIVYEGREFPLPPTIAPKAVEEPHHQPVIDIILKAMNLEKQAEKAYADLAAQITDSQGHDMFRKLSEEEHKHYRLLTEAYWNLSNFKAWKWTTP